MAQMMRRDFLKTAAATGILLRTGWAAEPRFKLAVKYGMVKDGATVLEKFKLLKSLGYDGIELDSPSKLEMDEVLRARDESKLPIHGVVDSVHWKKTLSHKDQKVRDEGRKALETALKECKRYGGSTVLLVPRRVRRRGGGAREAGGLAWTATEFRDSRKLKREFLSAGA